MQTWDKDYLREKQVETIMPMPHMVGGTKGWKAIMIRMCHVVSGTIGKTNENHIHV